jgi:8-oxo-dGTP pyrophosphatase MutT (NUDIX family)
MATPERPRAAAAVVRTEGTEILLVKHRWRDGTTSWILPGGTLLAGETPEEAVLRELDEETGLKGTVVRFLFSMPYDLGTSATFLVEVDASAQVSLGYDPEEAQKSSKMLQDVAWFLIKDVGEHREVRQVLVFLEGPVPEHGEEEESSLPGF